jgi:methanogenic corrinoid protein MtbC1/DNA-binding XRE family transcriptional regulator
VILVAGKKNNINPDQVKESYLQALLAGDSDAASGAVAKLFSAGVNLLEIYLNVLTPAMVKIGDLWCESKINVAQEHLATQITFAQMEKLKLMHAISRPARYRVMVSCVEGELHSLGARMAADLFQLEGWSVDFLGPDVPSRALIDIVNARRPDLLGLSVTLGTNLRSLTVLLKGLMTIADRPKLIVGGYVAESGGSWKSQFQGLEIAASVAEGLKLARKLFKPSRSLVFLNEYLKDLGQRIRGLRLEMGWTQEQLASATKLTRAYLVSVEGGKQNVSMNVVVRIANALNVSPDQLLRRDESGGDSRTRLLLERN